MGVHDDSALASLLLTNRLFDVGAEPLRSKDYWRLLERVEDPARLLGGSAAALVADHGLDEAEAEQVARLLDAATAMALELEQFQQRGLRAVSPFDATYPERLRSRLGSAAPPVLYVAGPPELLLQAEGIAVVGSRSIDDRGAEVTRTVAELTVEQGWPLVSGGAKGCDQIAMDAAYAACGTVIGVIADGLARRLRQPEVRRAIGRERVCLVTPYKPTAGFSVANAMGRNKIIYALARVTLVVAADADKGGTWEGAVEALRRGFGQVAVWLGDGRGPGNQRLVERGARPITDPSALFQALPAMTAPPEQLRLGV